MTAAPTANAEDAAWARRNAKVAGEVARCSGGSNTVSGKGGRLFLKISYWNAIQLVHQSLHVQYWCWSCLAI